MSDDADEETLLVLTADTATIVVGVKHISVTRK